MRWEEQHGGYVLRTSYVVLDRLFAGLVYPLSKGRWIGEVFHKDLAKGFGSLEEAKKFVEGNL